MTTIGVDVFDCYDENKRDFRLDEAVSTDPASPKGLHWLRMDGVTFYIMPERLRELAAVILDKFPLVAPMPEVDFSEADGLEVERAAYEGMV